jgi:DNA (cytosine-5)-methyltransferase 1
MRLPVTVSLEDLGVTLAKVLKVSKVFMNSRRDSERVIGFTLRCGGKRSPISDRRNWDQYYVRTIDGKDKERTLTESDGLRLMGFPSERRFPKGLSYSQMMKQLGNSVAVPAIRDWGRQILLAMGYEPGKDD